MYLALSLFLTTAIGGQGPVNALSLLSKHGSELAYSQIRLLDGKLSERKLWSVPHRDRSYAFVKAGSEFVSVLGNEADGASFLDIRSIERQGHLAVSFTSITGFSSAWKTPQHLTIWGDEHGMMTRFGSTTVEVIRRQSISKFQYLTQDQTAAVHHILEEMRRQGKMMWPQTVSSESTLNSFNSNPMGAYDVRMRRAVVSVQEPDGSSSVQLLDYPSCRLVKVLRHTGPRTLAAGGSLVAIVEGGWLEEGTVYLYSLSTGKYLGMRKVLCVG